MKEGINVFNTVEKNNLKPIWVLHTCNRLSIGGVQSFLMNFYKAIDRRRVQFAFAVQRETELPYDKEILSLGGRIHYLPRIEDGAIKYMKSLRLVIKNHPEYKIVHSHMNQRNALALLVAKQMNVPIRISHAHNISSCYTILSKIRYQIFKKIIAYTANNFWTCSYAANECVHFPNKHEIIIHNAIDIKRFIFNSEIRHEIREIYDIKEDDVVIGHIGNFSPQKNTSYLLSIIDKLPSNYKLLLVGEGKEKLSLENSELVNKNIKRIIFTGSADSSKMFQAMDIFVFPSLFEGLGMVAIEAIASGLPVIASKGVPNDIDISEYVCHLSIEACDIPLWVNKILSFGKIKRQNNFECLKLAGYNIYDEAEHLLSMYEELMNTKEVKYGF